MRTGLPRWVPRIAAAALWWSVGACGDPPTGEAKGVRVIADPYAEVSWATDRWLKAQLHDHAGTDTARIRAYDRAGYQAISLMTYSGVDSLSYAWRERRWPVEAWLSSKFLQSLGNIQVFFPEAEEVGYDHITSPFLPVFIKRRTSPGDTVPSYGSAQECVWLIRSRGGLAILAHPWTSAARITGLFGVEVYSAYAEYRRAVVRDSQYVNVDRNQQILARWDSLLANDPAIRGVAVNDHYGPGNRSTGLPASIRDSGKILVLASAAELGSLRRAIERGSFFAIRDFSPTKDGYPSIDSIKTDSQAIEIFGARGEVRWSSRGQTIATTPRLGLAAISPGLRYVRAEVVDSLGSALFTQAFALEPVK